MLGLGDIRTGEREIETTNSAAKKRDDKVRELETIRIGEIKNCLIGLEKDRGVEKNSSGIVRQQNIICILKIAVFAIIVGLEISAGIGNKKVIFGMF